MSLEKLQWDTDFFGLPIYRGTPEAGTTAREVVNAAKQTDCRLLYLTSSRCIDAEVVESLGGVLVDVKTTFAKRFASEPIAVGHEIETYAVDDNPEAMRRLAVQSGEYSRFNIDRKLPHNAFEKLYETWIRRSILREIALDVLVIREQQLPVGLITLGEKNGRADIGILAVDSGTRGKGYGVALVNAAENWFIRHGYTHGQVVTQGNNDAACRLYRKCGYAAESEEFFYHFWFQAPA